MRGEIMKLIGGPHAGRKVYVPRPYPEVIECASKAAGGIGTIDDRYQSRDDASKYRRRVFQNPDERRISIYVHEDIGDADVFAELVHGYRGRA